VLLDLEDLEDVGRLERRLVERMVGVVREVS
jgi:hypothetical protein